MKKTLTTLAIAVLIIMTGFAVFKYLNPNFFKIDKCLDNGGSWDHKQEICVYG